MAQRQQKSKAKTDKAKTDVKRIFDKIKKQVPPVVIKGGSIDVEFPIDAFDDDVNHTKVRLAKHPDRSRKITLILITDDKDHFLSAYTLPESLKGKCIIRVFDNK